jgi:mRNA-degrading endonuclease RelE of RelBE toxin-antitoxin system
MEVTYDKSFLKLAKKLPKPIQSTLGKKITLLQQDPFDSRLHTKQLSTPLEGIFSFRINRDYRVLFRFDSPTVLFLLSVKHRKDIYR